VAIKATPPPYAIKPVEGDTLTEAPKTLKLATRFEPDDYDEGLDVNALPALPWTKEALGEEVFSQLATVAGVGNLADHQLDPSLDPRSFGITRAKRLIRMHGLKGEQAQAYMEEGAALQEAIDEVLPPVRGTARNPTARPLKPARTVTKERGPGPKMWS